MEKILQLIDKQLQTNTEESVDQFYQEISKLKCSNNTEVSFLYENVIPKIYELYKRKTLKKDLLYLTLLSCKNFETLQIFLRYDKSVYNLDIKDPLSLYNYCIYKKEHWFGEILLNCTEYLGEFSDPIQNKILVLKTLQIINTSNINFELLKSLLGMVQYECIDPFWKNMLNFIKHCLHITNFCENINPEINKTEVFFHIMNHPVLETFSNYLDLNKLDYESILIEITENDKLCSKKRYGLEYTSFFILSRILKCINNEIQGQNIPFVITDLKQKLLQIEDKTWQVQLLRNIFTMIFTKHSHVDITKNEDEYICKEKDIRLILHLLKDVLDEIQANSEYSKQSEAYSKLIKLHRCVADGLWRLQLIQSVKNERKVNEKCLKYMLASPESLIQMCLRHKDFERSYQVIQIFALENQFIPLEVEYLEKLSDLKDNIKKKFKVRAIQVDNPQLSTSNIDVAVEKNVEQFFKKNPTVINKNLEDLVDCLSKKNSSFLHFTTKNEVFMNMLDLALTQPSKYEDCEILLQLAFENNTLDSNVSSTYSRFCKKILDVCSEINVSASQVLISPEYHIDMAKQRKENEFYVELAELYDEFHANLNLNEPGTLNASHPSHITLMNINKLCSEYIGLNTGSNQYLHKLFGYIKAFSKIFYIEQNTSDIISNGNNTSYFSILDYNRSQIMGKLLFEKKLDPGEYEKYFSKLKLDFLYHVTGTCFPTINLHTQENVTIDELYPEVHLFIPNRSIIAYIQKRNWLLAFLLIKMFNIEDIKINVSEVRIQVFLNYLGLSKIDHLKVLHDQNIIVTALQNEISVQKVTNYINSQIVRQDTMGSSHYSTISNESFEAAEELLENTLKTTDWKALYSIIDSIPENQCKKNLSLTELKDTIIVNMVQDRFEVEFYKYVSFINNRDLRIDTILSGMKEWPGKFCINIIRAEVTRFVAVRDKKLKDLENWLNIIALNEELLQLLSVSIWYSSHNICETQPERVMKSLLEINRVELLLEFIKLYKIRDDLLEVVTDNYFLKIFDTTESLDLIKMLLDNMPYQHALNVCYGLLKKLKHLDHLQFIVKYLMHNVDDETLINVEMSLKMLTVFTQTELDQLLCLIYDPLCIVEVLIMNTKLDKLSSVLNIVKSQIPYTGADDNRLSVETIDALLRKYAERTLDFDVITNPNPRLLRTPEHKLMQSLDSLNLDSDNGFIMPDEVPTKDEWVPNSEVVECMLCKKITFSMFNRRHHCRRCGRVICCNCSMHRMQVPSYGDILVRVCEDCYKQTLGSDTSETLDSVSSKSLTNDFWILTNDAEHNKIVREEFCYEHAPSVSLCLALMKYHSKSIEHPRFLLDQCKSTFELLLPTQEPVQGIDYFLVIKMLKSLTIAAKMSSLECNLQTGASLADRILSQAELLSLLAERGCLNLLSVTNTHSNKEVYIDATILRRLRDKLLEREQWNLALEVSTKAGLDNTGIFATWGKSCLKAGCLQMAREKFQRCLDKTGYSESLDYSISEEPSSSCTLKSRTVSKSSLLSTCDKPAKNPILLDEIIYLLESNTQSISKDVTEMAEQQKLTGSVSTLSFNISAQADVAICILNKLKNLKNTSAGNYNQIDGKNKEPSSSKATIDKIFFDECVYYLTRYGSHLSLLEFYLRHGHFDKVLHYVLETQLSADIFIEIYMKCLKDGIINTFQEHMSIIDSSLEVWKDYLRHLCRHLEKQNMLHSLYQLQQYMGDYIRAAMTCVRFYQENIVNFTDLLRNVHFLTSAEEHLKHVIEQEQWIEVAAVRKLSSTSRESFEEKGIVNYSLVMKMNPKDINKHIKTIWLQNEVAAFLANCESLETKPTNILADLQSTEDNVLKSQDIRPKIPTLFGTITDKIHLAVLVIICGKTVEDGFDLSLRIIQEFKLKPLKIYGEAGKQLAKSNRYSGIAELVSCIKHTGTDDADITDICDQMLQLAVGTLIKANVSETKVEDLIKLMSDKAMKISAYIEAKQLKTAYFLAVKYKRMSDIRRISREAELLNQPSIKTLCQKVLQSYSTHTKDKE